MPCSAEPREIESVLQPSAAVGQSSAALALCHSTAGMDRGKMASALGRPRDTCPLRSFRQAFARLPCGSIRTHARSSLVRWLPQDCEREPSRFLPGSLGFSVAIPHAPLTSLRRKGYLQDEASQAVPLLAGGRERRKSNRPVCRARGKSFVLASAVGPEGQVVAVDRDLSRLGVLRSNRDRLRFPWVHPVAADLQERGFAPLLGLYSRRNPARRSLHRNRYSGPPTGRFGGGGNPRESRIARREAAPTPGSGRRTFLAPGGRLGCTPSAAWSPRKGIDNRSLPS
jgi:hypothetical protein